MSTLFYFIKEAFRGFFQAKLMTFVAIITVASSLFLMALIVTGYLNIELLLKKSSDQADIAAYLEDAFSIDKTALSGLVAQIEAFSEVKSVAFIDKETAWKRFEGSYGSDILQSVDNNPLPASIEIALKDKYSSVADAEAFKSRIEVLPGIDNVQYSKEWMETLSRFRFYFVSISSVVAVVILFALHFMISNTIKLTIYARKEIIRNMYYVGATELFIKMPFILEGMLQGLLGGIISVIALVMVKASLSHFSVYWGSPYMPFFIFLTGVFFGWIGSVTAVRKFLA